MESSKRRKVLVCTCERSMPDYGDSVARGCRGAEVESGNQLCGAELDRVRAMLAGAEAVTIGCTQQAPLFTEVAEDLGFAGELAFANIRETGGWSDAGADAGPKAAALMAMAAEAASAPSVVTLSSGGVVLVYGRDETAIEAGRRLADRLDVTVLLSRPAEVMPQRVWDFPVMRGTIRNAKGHLGAFELTVDDFAAPAPSSRGALRFGASRDGAVSRADIVLDLSGGDPLFPAHDLRDGYVRADPARPGGGRGGALEGGRSRRRVRQAALHRLLPRALRPFALAHHRLHALPRALPDRRDRPGRRPRRHRRRDLRRLRQLRRRLPDRGRRLRGPERRGAAAAGPDAASHLPRRRRRRPGACSSTMPATASR